MAIAAGRGDLSMTALRAAYDDLLGCLPYPESLQYPAVLDDDPPRVARWLRELAGADAP